MNAQSWILVLAHLAPSDTTRLALVAEGGRVEDCVLRETIASLLAYTPHIRIVRGQRGDTEAMSAFRVRFDAELAIDAHASSADLHGSETATVFIDERGAPMRAATVKTTLVREFLAAGAEDRALALPDFDLIDAPNIEALRALCAGDSDSAYRAAGPAPGRAMRRSLSPPKGGTERALATRSVLERWAHASALARRKAHTDAIPILRSVVASFERGDIVPLWRRAPHESSTRDETTTQVAVQWLGDVVITFDDGVFSALDPRTGATRWTRDIGNADPRAIDVGDGILVAVTTDAFVALARTTGAIVWRTPMRRPAPEIVVDGDRIYGADSERIVAIERSSGNIVWTIDPRLDIVAGPVAFGDRLFVPAETQILGIAAQDGTIANETRLGDEITSPIAITANGTMWIAVGSDDLATVTATSGSLLFTRGALPAVAWPPAFIGEEAFLSARRATGLTFVARVGPRKSDPIVPLDVGGHAPLRAMPDASGVVYVRERPGAVVLRARGGKPVWSVPQTSPVATLDFADGAVVVAAKDTLSLIDAKKGAVTLRLAFGETIRDVAFGPGGGAIASARGSIVGIAGRDDPRLAAWLREARHDLARSQLATGATKDARANAERMLEQDANDIDALAVLAAAAERASPRLAATTWLRVAASAPRGDPLQKDAIDALGRLCGIERRIRLDEPILDVVATTTSIAIARTARGEHEVFVGAFEDARGVAIASLSDDTLVAIDLATGKERGRLDVGKVGKMVQQGARTLVLDGSGALLVIDRARALGPKDSANRAAR